MIIEHITWRLGNGEKANFWKDSWDGKPALSMREDIDLIKQVFEAMWGTKVKDYLVLEQCNGIDVW